LTSKAPFYVFGVYLIDTLVLTPVLLIYVLFLTILQKA